MYPIRFILFQERKSKPDVIACVVDPFKLPQVVQAICNLRQPIFDICAMGPFHNDEVLIFSTGPFYR